jgi:PAS domain S-box-containing protein
LEALRAIGTEIARELDLPTLLSLLHRRVADLVGAAAGAVYLWDERTELLVPAAWQGIGEWFAEVRLRLGQGVAGTVAQQRRGMIVNEYHASPFALHLLVEEIGIAAVLAEPLVYRERLVGVITMNRRRDQEPFGEEDRRLLALFADQAAIAIANAQAHAAALRRANELAVLLRASRSIMAGLDLQEILDRIVTEAGPIAGTPHVKLLLVDKRAQVLRVSAVSGAAMAKDSSFPVGTGLSGWVAATASPLFVPECHLDPRNIFANHDRMVGFRTYLGLPIKGREEVLGVLTFSTTDPRRYTVEEVAYLTSFADQAAVALDNAGLYRVVRDRAKELETVRDIERAITSHLELPAVLDAVTAGATRLLRSRSAEVLLWDESGQCLRSGAAADAEAAPARTEGCTGIPDAVARTRQPLILDDYQASSFAVPECPEVVATITVPILFGDRLLGVLHSHTTEAGKCFTVEDLRRLRSLAAQSAIAIENARLFARVAQAKAEWEHTFDAIPDLVALIDGESRLLRVNRALAARVGQTPNALIGQPCYAVLHGSECPWPDCPHERTLATGQSATQVVEDPYLGGAFLITTAPLPGEAGRAPGSVHIARDVTELRRLEAEARERQRAEDLSRGKSAFIANMSHELRSPLNAILGFSQLLLEQARTGLTEQQIRYAGNIYKSGQHLLQLITDILDLSRVEVGKLALQLASIPVVQTLDDILAIARGLANQKGQVIEITAAPDLPPLVADLLRVKQILFNLLSNAVKFTPTGGRITVTVRWRERAEMEALAGVRASQPPGVPASEWLEIAVSDTGAGIRAEDLPRLFGEFVQLETTRAQAHEGTGLGLALTKRLVELHGGRISAASQGEGQGSTFTVWLPFGGPAAQREE